jgi:hypothetical protein
MGAKLTLILFFLSTGIITYYGLKKPDPADIKDLSGAGLAKSKFPENPASVRELSRKISTPKVSYHYNFKSNTRTPIHFKWSQDIDVFGAEKKSSLITGLMELYPVGMVGQDVLVIIKVTFDKIASDFISPSMAHELGKLKIGDHQISATTSSSTAEKYENDFKKASLAVKIESNGKIKEILFFEKAQSNELRSLFGQLVVDAIPLAPSSDKLTWSEEMSVRGGPKFLMSFNKSTPKQDQLKLSGVYEKVIESNGSPMSESGQGKKIDCLWSLGLGLPLSSSDTYWFTSGGKTARSGFANFSSLVETKWGQSNVVDAIPNEVISSLSTTWDPKFAETRKNPLLAAKELSVIRQKLKQFEQHSGDWRQREQLLPKVSQLLLDHPDLTEMFGDWLRSYPPGTVPRSILIGALGYVGTPEAQKQLWTLFKDARPGTVEEKKKALVHFTVGHWQVTEESRKILADLYESKSEDKTLVGIARSTLGAILKRTRDAELEAIVSRDLGSALKSNHKEQIVEVLGVVGNSGNPVFVPELEKIKASNDSEIRVALAQTTRFYQDQNVASIRRALMKDTNPEVRKSAYWAETFQDPSFKNVEKYEICASQDPDPEVRRTCYQTIITRSFDREKLRPFLLSRLKHETSDSNRIMIEETLKK